MLMLNAQDEHSLPRERVNGPLTNSPDFHRAFGCKLGTPMCDEPGARDEAVSDVVARSGA